MRDYKKYINGLKQVIKNDIDARLDTSTIEVKLFTITFWEAICYGIDHWQPNFKNIILNLIRKSLSFSSMFNLLIIVVIVGILLSSRNKATFNRGIYCEIVTVVRSDNMIWNLVLYAVSYYYCLIIPFFVFNLDLFAALNKLDRGLLWSFIVIAVLYTYIRSLHKIIEKIENEVKEYN